ncbi:MAG: hypothetical protein HY868_03170 [Chloroflexi bacterium]|nr:hypothetical protein [Chloroflexota bacterium]
MSDDILEQLIVKREQLERDQKTQLVKMVLPFAAIDPEKGRVHPKAPFDELNAKHKVLVYLLARLALSALPDAKTSAAVSPKEVEDETGLPGGTVRPKLTQLEKERLVIRNEGGYYVTSAILHRAFKELESYLSKTE